MFFILLGGILCAAIACGFEYFSKAVKGQDGPKRKVSLTRGWLMSFYVLMVQHLFTMIHDIFKKGFKLFTWYCEIWLLNNLSDTAWYDPPTFLFFIFGQM